VPRWPTRRLAASTAGLAVLATLWWYLAGQPLISALS
jgi:hypothetical protein